MHIVHKWYWSVKSVVEFYLLAMGVSPCLYLSNQRAGPVQPIKQLSVQVLFTLLVRQSPSGAAPAP